jgi:hypothetical protein
MLDCAMRPPPAKPSRAQMTQTASEARDRLVKDMVEKERIAVEAKTAKLRALRLAKEASEPQSTPRTRNRKPAG